MAGAPDASSRELARALAALEARIDALFGKRARARAGMDRLRIAWLSRALARELFARLGLRLPAGSRLLRQTGAEARFDARLDADGEAREARTELVPRLLLEGAEPEALGLAYERLLSWERVSPRSTSRTPSRKRTGSFFTPRALTTPVVVEALERVRDLGRPDSAELSICDPACGGGAFLLEAARQIVERRRAAGPCSPEEERALRRRVVAALAGVDSDALALGIAELALFAYVNDPELLPSAAGRLHEGDALTGRGFSGREWLPRDGGLDWSRAFAAESGRGFDLVIGNPPWIAYAGRATRPLAAGRRAYFARAYHAFHGYPTLHALFVERAAELAPHGVVCLLVPSPLADLDGYAPARRALSATHTPCEPMLEFGQDAFAAVTQPCFALVARPRDERDQHDESSPPGARRFRLRERARAGARATLVEPPAVLARLLLGERLPVESFREMGLQTTRLVTEKLLLRADAPDAEHTYPLLEGREVREFRVGRPRLFLRPDAETLRRAGCRLRAAEQYRAVELVVRQTAKAPIAALHTGLPFRNTLLAGFGSAELPASVLVGLLNSTLYRALHLAEQRDGRQATFPQVKIGHLRALPRPPRRSGSLELAELVARATRDGPTREQRLALDRAVFDLFELSEAERVEIASFLRERAPELAPA